MIFEYGYHNLSCCLATQLHQALPLISPQQVPRVVVQPVSPVLALKHPPYESNSLVVSAVEVQLLHGVQQLLRLRLGDLAPAKRQVNVFPYLLAAPPSMSASTQDFFSFWPGKLYAEA